MEQTTSSSNNSPSQETKILNFQNFAILSMPATVEERFAKLSLGTDGKRYENLTRIILATVYPSNSVPKTREDWGGKVGPFVAG